MEKKTKVYTVYIYNAGKSRFEIECENVKDAVKEAIKKYRYNLAPMITYISKPMEKSK